MGTSSVTSHWSHPPTHFLKHFFVFLFSTTLHPKFLSLTFPFVAFAISTLGAFHLVSSSSSSPSPSSPSRGQWSVVDLWGPSFQVAQWRVVKTSLHPLALSNHLPTPY